MSRQSPPAFWTLFLMRYLGASARLAWQLWRVLDTPVLRWHLELCAAFPTPERVQRLAGLLSPRVLVDAAERLSPPGTRRREEIVQFEEAVLQRTTQHGTWR